MQRRIYLDANAGAPLLPEVRAAMIGALEKVANPSSVHAEGRAARAMIEAARARVAAAVGARPENVVFTSGGTEAAALALTPDYLRGKERVRFGRLYVGATEHLCVLGGGRFPADRVTRLPVGRSGAIDLDLLDRTLAAHPEDQGPALVALMLANNETGAIHPIAQAAAIVQRHGATLFCDAVQAWGKIPVDVQALGADLVSISAHKIGGPQGAGALVLADGSLRPAPLASGGGQERGRRSGTENLIAIVGFGVAAEAAKVHLEHADRIGSLRARLEAELRRVTPGARIIAADARRVPNTTMLVVPGLSAETAVIALDLEGVAVSAGSACSSGKIAASHVLEAMGEEPEGARSGIRVSLPWTAQDADVEAFIEAWRLVHSRIGRSRAA